MSANDQILVDLAYKMAQEIDTEILMTAMGWHKLELSDGLVHSKRYVTVHPDNGEHWNEMMTWMVETFGATAHDGVWTPDMRWYANNAKFWFRDPADLTLFVLKWS